MAERFFHFFYRLVIKFVRTELHALGVVHGGLRLYAEQHLMRLGVISVKVVAVVGGYQRQVACFSQIDEPGIGFFLLFKSVC